MARRYSRRRSRSRSRSRSYRRYSNRRYSRRRSSGPKRRSYNRSFTYRHKTAHAGCGMRKTPGECGSDPNCNWVGTRCQKRMGVSAGTAYAGPMGPPAGWTGSGGRRRSRRRSSRRRSRRRSKH